MKLLAQLPAFYVVPKMKLRGVKDTLNVPRVQ
jgi:hypothetical protein